jgi:hypothetical protein
MHCGYGIENLNAGKETSMLALADITLHKHLSSVDGVLLMVG